MNECLQHEQELNKYCTPTIDIYSLDVKDVLCLSKEESFDNEFDAGDLGL